MACIATGTSLPAKGEGKRLVNPNSILRKPIPDKLVVLTFDDSPASHAQDRGADLEVAGIRGVDLCLRLRFLPHA